MTNLANFLGALPSAISQGLIWGIMAIGVYITYRVLDVSDLTVDGSFCTGGVTFVVLFTSGMNIWLALLSAFLVGALTGLVTGLLHTLCGIPAILAGILTQLGLWSVNLAIMSMKANVSINVIDKTSLNRLMVSLRFVQDVAKGERPVWQHPIIVVGLFTVAVIAVLYWFFGTELGCSLRATGSNPNMARAQGINTDRNKVLALMISNGLVAVSGALLAQYQSYGDINMGRGAIVIGLAAIIVGDVAFGTGDHVTARQQWDLAVEKSPNAWQAYCDRADRYKKIGLVQEAIADYERSFEMQAPPRLSDGLYSLVQVYERAGAYDKAIETYERILTCLREEHGQVFATAEESCRKEMTRLQRLAEQGN